MLTVESLRRQEKSKKGRNNLPPGIDYRFGTFLVTVKGFKPLFIYHIGYGSRNGKHALSTDRLMVLHNSQDSQFLTIYIEAA